MPIRFKLRTVVEPAVEPVTLTEAQTHCRVDVVESDPYMASLIATARKKAENHLRRALITQTLELILTVTTLSIDLPHPEIQEVLEVAEIDESDGTETIIAPTEYFLIGNELMFKRTLTYGQTLRIKYVAGYGDSAADVPEPIKTAILHYVSHLYNNREGQLTSEVQYMPGSGSNDIAFANVLLSPYQIKRI